MNVQQVMIPSENPKVPETEYRVTVVDDTVVACTCRGFHYRGECRHIKEVQARIDSTG